ncbi:DUF1405 domain-containing protein [Salsuginibacillus halophilus]|nr:DUF1405 domain-containing protein [Salsuginibacillus halophilus]
MKQRLKALLMSPKVLGLLLVINAVGTLYGYIWYIDQLMITPPQFLIFVPDSPTASLFFCIVLFLWLLNRRSGLIEALAAVTLIKYGIWAVVMNAGAGFAGDELNWQNYMLIVSHGAMAVQALLYLPFYHIRRWHLTVAAVWTVHNDMIDYMYNVYPWVSPYLLDGIHHIGYFTFWLSLLSIGLIYVLHVRRQPVDVPS